MGFKPTTSTLVMSYSIIELHLRIGAKDRVRSGDPDVGNVMLYQLSYFRIFSEEGGSRTHKFHGLNVLPLNHSATSPLVRMKGLEPPRFSAPAPKAGVSTIPPHPLFECYSFRNPTSFNLLCNSNCNSPYIHSPLLVKQPS